MASTSSSVGLVQGHVSRPTHVARCFRGRLCPYRLRDACWFGHDDDLEGVPLCRDVAATSSLPLRAGSPVFAGLEADTVVTKEIVDYVGQWEEIVDVPVLSRSLDTELGDRVLQVLEQIVEVLKVLPERIASQLKGWSYDERISERLGEQTVDLPVPQVMESVEMQLQCVTEQITDLFVGERVQNCTPEQTMVFPVPQFVEECVQNRTPEQIIVDFPVPQIMEIVEECVQNRTHEQIVVSPMPQLVEECVQNRIPEQIVDFPVPQIMEAAVDFLLPSPQEVVQNCSSEQIVDFPVPQIVEECVQNRAQEQNADSTVPQFMEAAVENCVGEQSSHSFVPQFMGADVEFMHATPQVRMQTRTPEQTMAFPVPQFSEECVPDRLPEQTVDFPVSQNMEAYAGRVRDIPLERVQLHSFVRPKRVFVDDFLSLHKASKPYTGKVFTVNLRHHRDDFAHSDNLGFIKGLDKHNMPRFGDVVVPPSRLPRVLWDMWSKWFLGSTGNHRLLRTGLCTAFNQSGRVAVAAPSSYVELLRLQQVHFLAKGLLPGRVLQRFDEQIFAKTGLRC